MKTYKEFLTEANESSEDTLRRAIAGHKEFADAGVHTAAITRQKIVGSHGHTHHLTHTVEHKDAQPVTRTIPDSTGSMEITTKPERDTYRISHHQDLDDHNSTHHHVYIEHTHQDMEHHKTTTNMTHHVNFDPKGKPIVHVSNFTKYPQK